MTKQEVQYNPLLHNTMRQLIALESSERPFGEVEEDFIDLLNLYLITAKPGLMLSSEVVVRGEMFKLESVSILRVMNSYPEFQLIDTEGNVWMDVTLDEITVVE